jgi:serine/arginine repetitive matrix protein 2
LHERRRPASPLSSLAHSGNPQSYFSDIESPSPTAGHSRQSSMNGYEQYAGTHARSNSVARSLLSPALPDSPMLNSSHNSFTNYAPSGIPDTVSVPTIDLGSPGRNGRSFGYQYTHSKSASSPGVSEYDHNAFASHRRSPKPHTSNGSAYTSHAYSQSLILSPILNSSQSSLLSTGSSYHSTTESSRKASDAAFSMMRDSSSSSQTSPGLFDEDAQDDKPPETVNRKQMDYGDALRFFGLTPEYIAAFQEKLLHAASPDLVLAPRTPSLRRRTNSINDRVSTNYVRNTHD